MSGAADDDDGPIITVDLAKHWLRQGKSWESFCAVVVFVVDLLVLTAMVVMVVAMAAYCIVMVAIVAKTNFENPNPKPATTEQHCKAGGAAT